MANTSSSRAVDVPLHFRDDLAKQDKALVQGQWVTFTPNAMRDLRTVLNRAMNTWEDRPEWLVRLCDHITNPPPPTLIRDDEEDEETK